MHQRTRHPSFGLFIAINCIVATFIGLRYLTFLPIDYENVFDYFFYNSALISQMSILIGLISCFCLPALLIKNNVIRKCLLASTMTVAITLVIADVIVFSQFRFHINWLYIQFMFDDEIVQLAWQVWALIVLLIGAIFYSQSLLLNYLSTPNKLASFRLCKKTFILILFCSLFTHLSHVYGSAYFIKKITMVRDYLPLFSGLTTDTLLRKYGLIDYQKVKEQQSKRFPMAKKSQPLHYPSQPLEFSPTEKPPHIFIIMIDSWRVDTFTPDNTPNLWKMSDKGVRFKHHYAASNRTWGGVSGFFYGIPASYWRDIARSEIQPVFVDRLQQLNYQMGIFTSAHLRKPKFNRTIFGGITNLRENSDGNAPHERDIDLTNDWLAWMEHQDTSQPIFSFLFYDAAHGLDLPPNYAHRYEPMPDYINFVMLNENTDPEPIMNRYKTSVHFVDSLIAQVSEKLEQKGILDNSLIIITGDHGEEWNDNGLGYWKHGSNFTDPQIHVPLAIITPDKQQPDTEQITTHTDLVPTIMESYLNVQSPSDVYSTGENIFKPQDRDFILVANTSKYAIITLEDILVVSAYGDYRYYDKRYRPIDKKIDPKKLAQAMERISRFHAR